jgi:hypothetical protein
VRPRRHLLGEGLLRAGQALGDHDTGIVARLHDDAAQKVLDRNPLADLDEHLRAAHAPGFLAHGELVVELQAAVMQALEHHEHGHQLAHRGRRQRLIGILGIQHLTRIVVDQDRCPGEGLVGLGARRQDQRHGDQKPEDQAAVQPKLVHHQFLAI